MPIAHAIGIDDAPIPEPIRTAHPIGSGVTTGES
jgi:hypothetical protein